MTQAEVKDIVQAAQVSVNEAFWQHQDEPLGEELLDLETALNDLLTKLDQDDLSSRTDEFTEAANAVKNTILPGIKKLDASVAKLIAMDNELKSALAALVKLGSSVSFFALPLPF